MSVGDVALKTALLMTSLAAGAVAGEFVLRAADYPYRAVEFVPSPIAGYSLMRPNQEFVADLGGPLTHVRINSIGLRGEEPDPHRCWTLLALGDSFTFENRYPPALQARLEERYGPGVEVINAGYGGETVDLQTIVFDEQGVRVRPDVVLLQFFVNDIEEVLQRRQTESLQAPLTASFPLKGYLRQTAVYQLLHRLHLSHRWQAINQVENAAGTPLVERWFRSDEFYAKPLSPRLDKAWKVYLEQVDRLIQKVERAGARFLMVIIPDWYQVTNADWAPLPQEIIARFGEGRGIPVVDVLDTFRRLESSVATLYRDPDTDGHLSARGDAIVVQMLFEELVRTNWVHSCAR